MQVIHPLVSYSMDKWAWARTVSSFVYNIFCLDAAKKNVGPSRTTLYTLCKHDQLFVFNCAAYTTTTPQISKSQSYGQKASPVEVPVEL